MGLPSLVSIRNVLCLASTGRIDPAAVRMSLLWIEEAAPRYALTPTLSLDILEEVLPFNNLSKAKEAFDIGHREGINAGLDRGNSSSY
jgi:hypothetical protein